MNKRNILTSEYDCDVLRVFDERFSAPTNLGSPGAHDSGLACASPTLPVELKPPRVATPPLVVRH